MDRLPPELLSHIIGFNTCNEIWEPTPWPGYKFYSKGEVLAKKSLRALSTVSHQLRQVTLPYLFRTVAILLDPTLEKSAKNRFGRVYRCLPDLITFTDEYADTLVPLVQELRIVVRTCSGGLPKGGWETMPVDTKPLITFLHQLPKLRTVGFQNAFFTPSDDLILSGMKKQPSLENLHLYLDCEDENAKCELRTILPLLNSFERIQAVYLQSFGFSDDNLAMQSDLTVRLDSLEFVECDNINVFLAVMHRSMAANPLLQPLRSLHLSRIFSDDLHAIGEVVSLVGMHLHRLTLCMSHFLDENDELPNVQQMTSIFASCSQLQSFTLKWDLDPKAFVPTVAIPRLCSILSFLHLCPTLKAMVIELDTVVASSVAEIGDAFLMTIEGEGTFAPVQRTLLEFDGLSKAIVLLSWFRQHENEPGYQSVIEDFTRLNFSRLQEKGIFLLEPLYDINMYNTFYSPLGL